MITRRTRAAQGGAYCARAGLVKAEDLGVGVGVGVISHRILQADEGPVISKEPEGLRLVPTLQRRDKGG